MHWLLAAPGYWKGWVPSAFSLAGSQGEERILINNCLRSQTLKSLGKIKLGQGPGIPTKLSSHTLIRIYFIGDAVFCSVGMEVFILKN